MSTSGLVKWVRAKLTRGVLIAFALGLIIGLVVLGWWVWPVQWTDTDPSDLRPVHQDTYLQLIADSFALNGNGDLARARLEALKKPGQQDVDLSAMIMAAARSRREAGRTEDALRLQRLVTALGLPLSPTAEQPSAQPGPPSSSKWLRALGVLFFLGLLGAGLFLLLTQLQKREPARRRRPVSTSLAPSKLREEESGEVVLPPSREGAFAQFETTYRASGEVYDVSYSIESATGEFLGDCGVSALKRTDAEQPGVVSAFDVWLFDKLDSRTETKVLMSRRAFADPAQRAKLTERGELVQAEKGKTITLDTENLRLYATITDLEYAAGSNSGAFTRMTTKLEVVPKEGSL